MVPWLSCAKKLKAKIEEDEEKKPRKRAVRKKAEKGDSPGIIIEKLKRKMHKED